VIGIFFSWLCSFCWYCQQAEYAEDEADDEDNGDEESVLGVISVINLTYNKVYHLNIMHYYKEYVNMVAFGILGNFTPW